ncbi:MAG: FIST domain containing protein [Planctomycetes bacterium]|nr:FIST domain containing protein [Planctomycetota bacterium]MCP4770682.1 FIST domain containing protein [Planctomycetota bacterium]MCP4860565.1 FIST domain containing protein [Planctomycetota bacterium]
MIVNTSSSIRRAASTAGTAAQAVAELYQGIEQEEIALAVFFASPAYDQKELAAALKEHFGNIPLIGCTTAGEIGPSGYRESSISGFSLSSADFTAVPTLVENLQDMELGHGKDVAMRALNEMRKAGSEPTGDNTFAFVLVDGLSVREEALVSSLYKPLGDINLFGGSAGDDLDFGETLIWHEGKFHHNAAIFSLIQTDLPFKVFRTQHFVPTETKMVVTESDPLKRIVSEINGEPAAREYARMVGLEVEELTPTVFSAHPVVMRVGGEFYVRSIAHVNEDETLSFFCSIDDGIVLTVARGLDMAEGVDHAFEGLRERLGPLQLTIGCDCILRSLEGRDKEIRDDIAKTLEENNTIGFATYGEQYNAMHVNQTLTGVAIGSKSSQQ